MRTLRENAVTRRAIALVVNDLGQHEAQGIGVTGARLKCLDLE